MRRHGWRNSTSCYSGLLVALLLGAFALSGCASNIPKVKTYEEAEKEVAKRGPLVSPPIEEREGYDAGVSTQLDKGNPAPHNGLLLDEKKTTYYIAIKAERDRRRAELDAERKKAEIQKLIYESAIDNLRARADTSNTWWSRNKGLVGFAIGTTVGMAIVVGVLYALTGGKAVNTQSSALIAQPAR